jgi:hypothetical protein
MCAAFVIHIEVTISVAAKQASVQRPNTSMPRTGLKLP